MSIEYATGDLLDADVDALVNAVNTVGVTGGPSRCARRRAIRIPTISELEDIIRAESDVTDPEFLEPEQIGEIKTLLAQATSTGDLALRAHEAAGVIDDLRGTYFFSYFAGQRLRLSPNDPAPVPPRDVVVQELGSKRGLVPAPDELEVPSDVGVPLDGTAHLRLCPLDLGKHEVFLDARKHGAVDGLFASERLGAPPGPDLVWAAVVPSCEVLTDLTYDQIDDGPRPAFYRVRPAEDRASAYRARILRGLDLAASTGASIVALPELSTDFETERLIEEWFEATPSVALVVAGSRHLDDAREPRRNRARIFMRGLSRRDPLVHDKFSNFEIELAGVRRIEDIERPNVLTLILGRRWSFSALICKDFMETVARRTLVDLRLRAVIVASMSPKTQLFETDAAGVAQDAQAIVFISNAPHGAKDAIAIAALPRIGPPASCSSQSADGLVATFTANGASFQPKVIT